MYLSTHAAVGVLVSQSVDRPLYVFLLSVLSHFVLDFIPHGDEDIGRWAREKPKNALLLGFADVGILSLMIVVLYATQSLPEMALISAGIIGAVVPDLLSNIFPIIHHYTSWFFVERFIHRALDRLQFGHLWRLHDWFHRLTHNTTKQHLTIKQGLVLQGAIFLIAVALAIGLYVRPTG